MKFQYFFNVKYRFTSYIDIYLTLKNTTAVLFRLFDAGGRIVFQKSVKGNMGFNWFTIRNLDKLSGGAYMLHIITDSGTIVEKLARQ